VGKACGVDTGLRPRRHGKCGEMFSADDCRGTIRKLTLVDCDETRRAISVSKSPFRCTLNDHGVGQSPNNWRKRERCDSSAI